MIPKITYTGIDRKTDISKLPEVCEIGILYTVTTAGGNRYPDRDEVHAILDALDGRAASIHICGKAARTELLEGYLDDILDKVDRVQINGKVCVWELRTLCERYPGKVFITQHVQYNAHLADSGIVNHALLIDASGGRGISPNAWIPPKSSRPVGFAGGIGPDNIMQELERIEPIMKDGAWIDMESKIRDDDDWFDVDAVNQVQTVVERFDLTKRT